MPIADQAEHLAQLAAGYRRIDGPELLAAMMSAQNRMIDAETRRLDDPATGAQRRTHAGRAIGWATADRELLLAHRSVLLAAVSDQ